MSGGETASIFDAEAHGEGLTAAGGAKATSGRLEAMSNALKMGGQEDLLRQLRKAIELHRLFEARLAGILRQLGEGSR